jgi:hypothetical protein
MMSPTEILNGAARKRDQARLRQLRKRQRDRKDRVDLKAQTIADQMPASWRAEWLDRARRNRATKQRAAVEVEKTLVFIPKARHSEFLARNRPHTKVSLAELRNRFTREKQRAEQTRAEVVDGVLDDECDHDEPWWSDCGNFVPPMEREAAWDSIMLHPGSPDWWESALYEEGGLLCGPAEMGEAVLINPAAMAWRRARKRQAAACVCQSACVTSQPEYWLVSIQPPRPLRFRFVRRGKRIVIGAQRRRAPKDCEALDQSGQCAQDTLTALSRTQPNRCDRWGIPPDEAAK